MASIRRSVSLTVALGLPFLVLVGGAIAYMWAGSTAGQVDGVKVAYISGSANVRECPERSCKATATYKEGQQVVVAKKVTGQSVNGNRNWVKIQYGDEMRYIHESFVMPQSVSTFNNFWFLFSVLGMIPVIGLTALSQSPGDVGRWAVLSPRNFDTFLFGGVLATGLICGIVGFIYSRLAKEDTLSFVASAFANVGAGLVGAAVTFVLFQSLLSARGAEAGQVDAVKTGVISLRTEVSNVRNEISTAVAAGADTTSARLTDTQTSLLREIELLRSTLNQAIERQSALLASRLPEPPTSNGSGSSG
ncbi:hypothetical protein [Streptomyces sp. KS_5]|uniref:hypothetical protein n=1 Tax=Streptomyces TaxID=1883 RepID=UPI0008986BB1|nr:hypothetical protein [Streptomyces sp. KS_5]SED32554.1 hypothetical protein SAMN05428938_4594 [Streptomyces sp. KS_5]